MSAHARDYPGWSSAAKRIGISLDAYVARRKAGELWCSKHKGWKPAECFYPVKSRKSGRASHCRECSTLKDWPQRQPAGASPRVHARTPKLKTAIRAKTWAHKHDSSDVLELRRGSPWH